MRIYENVTRAIIEEMERGAVPWVRPWKTDRLGVGSVMPGNASTGRSYSGINIPILWASADKNGYPRHAWMTFRQTLDHGANVRKGERGTHVVFTKPVLFKGEDDEIEKHSMLGEYTVFNVAQIDGFAAVESPCRRSPTATPPSKRSSPRRTPTSALAATRRASCRATTSSPCPAPVLSRRSGHSTRSNSTNSVTGPATSRD